MDPESKPFPKPREESALEKKNERYPLLKGSQQCENGEVATHSLGRRSVLWWVGKTRWCRNTGWRRYLLFEGSFVVKGIGKEWSSGCREKWLSVQQAEGLRTSLPVQGDDSGEMEEQEGHRRQKGRSR